MGYLTTKIPIWIQTFKAWMTPDIEFETEHPTMIFSFSKKASSSTLFSTNSVNAWLDKIKSSNNGTITTVRSVENSNVETWIPEQLTPILIDEEHSIYAAFKKTQGEEQSPNDHDEPPYGLGRDGGKQNGQNMKLDLFSLHVYSTKESLDFLYKYHDDLVRDHLAYKASEYEKEPYIFHLEEYDDEYGEVVWDEQKFSSSRTMDHIWYNSVAIHLLNC